MSTMHSGSRRLRGSLARRPVAPLVIGHRGAAGYRPENTLASYEIAARLGADYIEPDLVATADGVLVARHEPEIGGSTDVARRPEFADRRRTVTVEGTDHTGWFTHDFTLAELRTLRATEPLPHIRQPNTVYDNRFGITTFDEILDLATRLSVGVYAEVKHPAHFAAIGIPLEPAVARTLATAPDDMPVVVESFDSGFLRSIRDELSVSITQLVEEEDADLVTPDGLARIASYAEGLGPAKDMVIPRDDGDDLGPPSSLVADAHAAGLLVFPYTFRNENRFLPAGLRRGTDPAHHGDAFGEYAAFLAAGIDGMFTDHPDTAVAAIAAYGQESWMMRR
jgi:glycerophosphoryl diester phosphodiesterase